MQNITLLYSRTAMILLLCASAHAADIDSASGREILQYARYVLQQTTGASPEPLASWRPGGFPSMSAPSGLFITLVKDNKVRGCYGSLTPQGGSLITQLQEYVAGAAILDFRHTPVRASEVKQIAIIISFIHAIEPVSSVSEICSCFPQPRVMTSFSLPAARRDSVLASMKKPSMPRASRLSSRT